MGTKYAVMICTAHECKRIEVKTKDLAEKIMKEIKDAIQYGNMFIELDDSLINLHYVEIVSIQEDKWKTPSDVPQELHPYEAVKHIDLPPSCPDFPKYTPTYTYGGPSWNPKVTSGTAAIDLDTSNKGTEPEKKDEGRTYVAEPDRFESLANTINEFRIETFQEKKRGKK